MQLKNNENKNKWLQNNYKYCKVITKNETKKR